MSWIHFASLHFTSPNWTCTELELDLKWRNGTAWHRMKRRVVYGEVRQGNNHPYLYLSPFTCIFYPSPLPFTRYLYTVTFSLTVHFLLSTFTFYLFTFLPFHIFTFSPFFNNFFFFFTIFQTFLHWSFCHSFSSKNFSCHEFFCNLCDIFEFCFFTFCFILFVHCFFFFSDFSGHIFTICFFFGLTF